MYAIRYVYITVYAVNPCFNLTVSTTLLTIVYEEKKYQKGYHKGSCTDHAWLMHFDCIHFCEDIYFFPR